MFSVRDAIGSTSLYSGVLEEEDLGELRESSGNQMNSVAYSGDVEIVSDEHIEKAHSSSKVSDTENVLNLKDRFSYPSCLIRKGKDLNVNPEASGMKSNEGECQVALITEQHLLAAIRDTKPMCVSRGKEEIPNVERFLQWGWDWAECPTGAEDYHGLGGVWRTWIGNFIEEMYIV